MESTSTNCVGASNGRWEYCLAASEDVTPSRMAGRGRSWLVLWFSTRSRPLQDQALPQALTMILIQYTLQLHCPHKGHDNDHPCMLWLNQPSGQTLWSAGKVMWSKTSVRTTIIMGTRLHTNAYIFCFGSNSVLISRYFGRGFRLALIGAF
jgi:hypothetical protein